MAAILSRAQFVKNILLPWPNSLREMQAIQWNILL